MRKLLSLILVAAMVLGLVGTAFAATATDVTGTQYESAVNRLNVLGILIGYSDGTFKPENNITRAEFAAVAVRALGLESAANNAKGATKFSDVPATHWASGYINLAVSRGIIKGYPNGTFAPEANVSNAEAMAMLIRVLGYEPAVTGEWPMNYVAKAAELGLTEGLSLMANVAATRGNVALMTDKALTVPLMVQTNFGTLTSYAADKDKSLLKTYLSVVEYDNMLVTATPLYDRVGLKSNEFRMKGTTENTYKFDTTLVDIEPFMGHTVKAWAKNGVVFNVQDKTSASKVITGTLSKTDATYIYLVDPNGGADIKYKVAGSCIAFQNHVTAGAYTALVNGSTVTLILNDDGLVVAALALKYSTADGKAAGVVSKVVNTADTQKIYYFDNNATKHELDLTNKTYTIVDAAGKVLTLADVAKMDVISIAAADSDNQYWIRIVRNKVEGTVAKVTTTDTTKYSAYRVYIGNTAYKLASDAIVTSDGGVTVNALDNTNADSLAGAKVVAYLNSAGAIKYVDSTAVVTKNVAVLYKTKWTVTTSTGDTTYVKLLKTDGTVETAMISPDAASSDVNWLLTAAAVGDVFEYTLDANGAILSATVINPTFDRTSAGNTVDFNKDYDRVSVGGVNYYIASTTVVFYDKSTGPAVTTWANVEGLGSNVYAKIWTNKDFAYRIDYLYVKNASPATTQSTAVAYKSQYNDGSYWHIVVDENGAEKDYTLTGTVPSTFKAGTLATLTFNASGKVSAINTMAPTATFTIGANAIDPVLKTIYNGGTAYVCTDKTVVYDNSGSALTLSEFGALGENDIIDVYVSASSGNVTYIVIQPQP